MAEAVVHRLEVVEVHEHHRERLAVADLTRESMAHAILEQIPIGEVGERVVEGLMGELLLAALNRSRHAVEHLDDHAELVVPVDGHAVIEIAPGELVDALVQLLDRSSYRTREKHADSGHGDEP